MNEHQIATLLQSVKGIDASLAKIAETLRLMQLLQAQTLTQRPPGR